MLTIVKSYSQTFSRLLDCLVNNAKKLLLTLYSSITLLDIDILYVLHLLNQFIQCVIPIYLRRVTPATASWMYTLIKDNKN